MTDKAYEDSGLEHIIMRSNKNLQFLLSKHFCNSKL